MWKAHCNVHLLLISALSAQADPVVTVHKDDTIIDRSCTVRIPKGVVIEDRNENGVVQIVGEGITVRFEAGSVLRGAPGDRPHDRLRGIGLVVRGHRKVRVLGARIAGFKIGVSAVEADGLVIEGARLDGNFRQRLGSTPAREDSADWLYPHHNDKGEWCTRYGAAVSIQRCREVQVRNIVVRRGQNGIVLDRVEHSRIEANDCSFLSGWGLAMWRSSHNVVTNNRFDFCIRGYSHGIYNRGQDSAGILMFEQCSDNVIMANSATHSGDGLFGFAGEGALGKTPKGDAKPDLLGGDRWRKGNNDNLIAFNDFSYAAAHGLEITFSFGNRVYRNRFVGNAICGIWGGYSQDMRIAGNLFQDNGDAGYGLERGGVNIEHGYRNVISNNTFVDNACGVHLWEDDDESLRKRPWAIANYRGALDNRILDNRFERDKTAIHLRNVRRTYCARNVFEDVARRIEQQGRASLVKTADATRFEDSRYFKSPVGHGLPKDRSGVRLPSRRLILMSEWGPWDHESPFVRRWTAANGIDRFEVYGVGTRISARLEGDKVGWRRRDATDPVAHVVFEVRPGASAAGLLPYLLRLEQTSSKTDKKPTWGKAFRGQLLRMQWRVRLFSWDKDPRTNEAAFFAAGRRGIQVKLPALNLQYGSGGPKDLKLSESVRKRGPGRDRFGTLAETRVPLKKGRYEIVTTSDDGVRVTVDGKRIIDNWTHHGPTRDVGVFVLRAAKTVKIEVAHFELDGHAVLQLGLRPLPALPK